MGPSRGGAPPRVAPAATSSSCNSRQGGPSGRRLPYRRVPCSEGCRVGHRCGRRQPPARRDSGPRGGIRPCCCCGRRPGRRHAVRRPGSGCCSPRRRGTPSRGRPIHLIRINLTVRRSQVGAKWFDTGRRRPGPTTHRLLGGSGRPRRATARDAVGGHGSHRPAINSTVLGRRGPVRGARAGKRETRVEQAHSEEAGGTTE